MKIVYISDSSLPSTSPNSVHVMKMCQAFHAAGHDVVLMGKNTTACLKDVRDLYEFYAVSGDFDISIYPKHAFRGSGMFYNLSFLWRAHFLRADLFYTRSITAAFFLLLYNKEVVFEAHEPYEGKGFRLKTMFSFIIKNKRLRRLVVISDSLRNYYLNGGWIDAEKIIVAHDAADAFIAKGAVIQDAAFKVGYVGSLYPGKGMETLVPLARSCGDVAFHIVGGNESQIQKLKRETRDVQNLIFHGFKSQQEIPGYISSFSVLIAPYTDRVIVSEKRGANNLALWMSPLKIFEYMASGIPIITTSLPVIMEILKDENNALLCDPDNLLQWKVAIYRLKDDPDLRLRLGRQALDDFRQKYTWDIRAQNILSSWTSDDHQHG